MLLGTTGGNPILPYEGTNVLEYWTENKQRTAIGFFVFAYTII